MRIFEKGVRPARHQHVCAPNRTVRKEKTTNSKDPSHGGSNSNIQWGIVPCNVWKPSQRKAVPSVPSRPENDSDTKGGRKVGHSDSSPNPNPNPNPSPNPNPDPDPNPNPNPNPNPKPNPNPHDHRNFGTLYSKSQMSSTFVPRCSLARDSKVRRRLESIYPCLPSRPHKVMKNIVDICIGVVWCVWCGGVWCGVWCGVCAMFTVEIGNKTKKTF